MSGDFFQMISEYEKAMHYKAMQYLSGNTAEAQDLVQDTIIKALDNEDKFEKGTNLRAWLLTILFHLFVNKHRRRKKFNEITDKHPSYTTSINTSESYSSDPVGPMEMESLLILLKGHLADDFYDVLYAVDVEGMSYKEAAAILDIPVGTVMSRLYRARRKAREHLVDEYDPEILEEYVGSVDALSN